MKIDYKKIVNDFDIDTQTTEGMLKAIENWSNIFNGKEPWINNDTISLHVAKTICEKVAKPVTIEYKAECTDEYINQVFQKFIRRLRTNTEFMLGKSCIFFKPYYKNGNIKVNVIQADKFIPVSFSDDGDLLGAIFIDQVIDGNRVYTRLEYNHLVDDGVEYQNIAYSGYLKGTLLDTKISLKEVEKWKNIEEHGKIIGVDRLIGGFATVPNANTIDNNSPLGQAIFHNAIETLEQIDKQFSRTVWEFYGTELAIDVDESVLIHNNDGTTDVPQGKNRLFRKFVFDETKEKSYNVFSPEIRENPLFNGLNEYLRQAEKQCNLEVGTLCKVELIAKTATEIKEGKQDYYVTVSDIQKALQGALDDLCYGIYVLCKQNNIPVGVDYQMYHDWDDSILVDKESKRNQALIERNNKLIDDVEYFMETRDMSEDQAIEYVKKINERRKLFEDPIESEEDEE